jgi:hypothetical protein
MLKNPSKRSRDLQIESFSVVNCNNKELQPFLNVFEFEGANFQEQKLGKLFGIIQILDHSESSAYIPNLIAQVIKKEFYHEPKRDPEKSFEVALHKANLTLSDLAQHEIVNWIENINSVVGIISKDNFYFTQVDSGKILLIRDKLLSEITQKIETGENDAVHPIKTFSELSFGKIQKDDKIIFTSKTIFDSFKKEELKRHSNVFSSQEFDNIFRSSLELEGKNVGSIVVNVTEKKPVINKKNSNANPDCKKDDENFFGATKKTSSQKKSSKKKKKKPKNEELIPEKDEKIKSPFEKEPELFIKEKDLANKEEQEKESKKISEKYSAENLKKLFSKDKALEYKEKIRNTKMIDFIKEKSETYKNNRSKKKISNPFTKENLEKIKKNKLLNKTLSQGKKFIKSLSAKKPSPDKTSKDRKKKLKDFDKV